MSLKQADLPLRTRRLIDEFIAPDSLDYVVCSHVAEHVPALIGWLKASAKVLHKGGCLACAFPDRPGQQRVHVHFTKGELTWRRGVCALCV